MASATLELIINGKVGAGFSAMMESVKSSVSSFKKEGASGFETLGNSIDRLQEKSLNFSDELAKGRKLLKADIKEGLLPFGAVIAGLTMATKGAVGFESSFAEIKKVVDGSDAEFTQLAQNLGAISNALPVSRMELNAIAAEAGKLGVALKDLPDFTETVAGGKIIFGMSAEEVGKAFATISAAFQLPITELKGVRDTVNEVSKIGAIPKDIFDVVQRISGQAVNMGMTADSAAALSATMLRLGNSPEVAGTALRNLLQSLSTAENGSKSFQEALEEIGLSAGQVKEMLKEPEKGLLEFLEILQKVDKSERTGILVRLFGRGNSSTAIASLVNSLDTYKSAIALSQNAQGSALKEIAVQSGTAANKAQLFKNALDGISLAIGNNLLPALTGILETLTPVIQAVGTFLSNYPKVTTGLILIVGSLMAGRVALSTFFYGLNMVVTLCNGAWRIGLMLAKVFSVVLVPAIKLVGTAIAFVGRLLLLNPIGLIITGIAVAAFLIYKYWEPIKNFFKGLWDTIKSVLGGLYEKMVSMGSYLIEGLINGIKKAGSALWQTLKDVGGGIKDTFKSLFGINSPSKVFQGFGVNLGEGLVLGINQSAGKTNAAAKRLVDLKSAGGSFAGGGAKGGGGEMRINYAPVINLSGAAQNVQREVSDALKNAQVEFEKMFKRMTAQNERRALV